MSWRVAVTRDEAADGPLGRALADEGFAPVVCAVMDEQPPHDAAPLIAAARGLEHFTWAIFSSQRAVQAVAAARGTAWPRGLRTAAVGARTADALVRAGADPAPVVADDAGAAALWATLRSRDTWTGTRVLVPAVSGGRPDLLDGLRAAGADVTVVEAYRMVARPAETIAADWRAASPDAVVIASPSAARALAEAVGREALVRLRAVVAIGETTRRALDDLGIPSTTPMSADFTAAAGHLAHLRESAPATAR